MKIVFIGLCLFCGAIAVDTPVKLIGTQYQQGSFFWIINNIFFQYYSLLIFVVCVIVMIVVVALMVVETYGKVKNINTLCMINWNCLLQIFFHLTF